MKNYLLLAAALLIAALAGFGAYQAYNAKQTKSTLDPKTTTFSVADTAGIDSLHVYYREGQKATLERVGKYWLLNDRYKASQPKVKQLLGVIHDVRAKAPLSPKARNTVLREMASSSYKVKIWKGDTLVRDLYVGPDSPGYAGTYMRHEGSEKVFETHIRGFNGFLSVYFQIDQEDFRSTEVFGTQPSYLQSFGVRYPKEPQKSFSLVYKNNYFAIEQVQNLDTMKLINYLEALENVHIERFLGSERPQLRDSLLLKTPDYLLKLDDRRPGKDNRIALFNWPGHPQRLLGLLGPQKEPVAVQRYVFGKLLKPRQFFRKPQSPASPDV